MKPLAARLAAPAAFLLAVTVAVVLVRSTLGDDEPAPRAATTTQARRAPPPATTRPRATPAATPRQQFHEIRVGDTLGSVASRYETSVEAIVELNPGVDPVGLQVGQRVRVK